MSDVPGEADRAAILARRQRFIALALGGLASGCTPSDPPADGGTTTTTASSSTTGDTETDSDSDSGDGDGDPDTTLTFVTTDPQPCLSVCDTFSQDCPEGEKCVPYASTGGTWDDDKCVPITGEGAAGEPCVYGGTAEATDDCGESTYCWAVQDVDGVLTGVCTPFCQGTPDAPICDDGTSCLIANDGAITLCVPDCDPLMQDCEAGLACAWTGATFSCLVSTEAVATGQPCGYANDCAPSNVCLQADASLACAFASCCVEYCAVDDPQACPDPQLECAPFFGVGEAHRIDHIQTAGSVGDQSDAQSSQAGIGIGGIAHRRLMGHNHCFEIGFLLGRIDR